MTDNRINVVSFYSEGAPNDRGLDLSHNVDLIIKSAKPHVDSMSFYTPTKLKDLGFYEYVKEYKYRGLVYKNPGMNFVGFCAWRPLILLLELEKMEEGDLLIYRDVNAVKYPSLCNYENIKGIANELLNKVNFDIFVPAENNSNKVEGFTKPNVINDLADNVTFSKDFPLLIANFIVVRKSVTSLNILEEWREACLNERLINGVPYNLLPLRFKWATPEQSILSVILSNYVYRSESGISKDYPLVYFNGRQIDYQIQLLKSKKTSDNDLFILKLFYTIYVVFKSTLFIVAIDFFKLNKLSFMKKINVKLRSILK